MNTQNNDLLYALEKLYRSFEHKEGQEKQNRLKLNIIMECEDVKEALNIARETIHKAKRE